MVDWLGHTSIDWTWELAHNLAIELVVEFHHQLLDKSSPNSCCITTHKTHHQKTRTIVWTYFKTPKVMIEIWIHDLFKPFMSMTSHNIFGTFYKLHKIMKCQWKTNAWLPIGMLTWMPSGDRACLRCGDHASYKLMSIHVSKPCYISMSLSIDESFFINTNLWHILLSLVLIIDTLSFSSYSSQFSLLQFNPIPWLWPWHFAAVPWLWPWHFVISHLHPK